MSKSKAKQPPLSAEIETMDSELRSVYTRIVKLQNRIDVDELRARYEIGNEIDKVMSDPRKYGDSAVEKLADSLAVSDQVLYRSRSIAVNFPSDEFEELIARKTSKGTTISFTHLCLLTTAACVGKFREQLIEEIFALGLSTDEVQERIVAATPSLSGPRPNLNLRPRSTMAGLKSMIATTNEILGQEEKWEDAIFDRLDEAYPNEIDTSLLDSLEEARQAFKDLQQRAERYAKRLDGYVRVTREEAKAKGELRPQPRVPSRVARVKKLAKQRTANPTAATAAGQPKAAK